MLKTVLCVSAFVLIGVSAKVGEVCTDVSTCDDGECCQIRVNSVWRAKNGTCQKIVKAGETCDNQAQWRGEMCACEKGFLCYSKPLGNAKTAVCEKPRPVQSTPLPVQRQPFPVQRPFPVQGLPPHPPPPMWFWF
ncbi:uncharacterized protein LOC101852073 [Aplysia californica]|uniref:Uncharacterized protein LOC101852073 n=1 Tax=Aplysia californica TaxID=6500 RepID=A0ABM1AE77_APLCA|nr:uncharacterized protein LOC101852073 [Aplysia californica]